jgi:hypothetical protein
MLAGQGSYGSGRRILGLPGEDLRLPGVGDRREISDRATRARLMRLGDRMVALGGPDWTTRPVDKRFLSGNDKILGGLR